MTLGRSQLLVWNLLFIAVNQFQWIIEIPNINRTNNACPSICVAFSKITFVFIWILAPSSLGLLGVGTLTSIGYLPVVHSDKSFLPTISFHFSVVYAEFRKYIFSRFSLSNICHRIKNSPVLDFCQYTALAFMPNVRFQKNNNYFYTSTSNNVYIQYLIIHKICQTVI